MLRSVEIGDEHSTRQIARELHHEMSLGRELSQPFINSHDGRRLSQYRVLSLALLLLGWFPKHMELHWACRIIVLFYQFMMFLAMSFGFYSISGATSDTMGSNVMGACVDFVYPLVWLASVSYFRTPHLSESLGRIEKNNKAVFIDYVSSAFVCLSFVICASWAIWQKSGWWLSLPQFKKQFAIDYVLLLIFTATLALRLFSVCLMVIVVHIVCYEHKLGVECFLRTAKTSHSFTNDLAVSKLLRQHMLLCDELRTTGKQLGTVIAMFLLTTFVCSIILMVGLYLDIITFLIFMNTASDFFLCFAFSILLIIAAASTSKCHGAISPKVTHYFWSQPNERVSADQMMRIVNYFTVNKATFEVVGIKIDGGTVSKLVSGLVSFFGLIALKKLGNN